MKIVSTLLCLVLSLLILSSCSQEQSMPHKALSTEDDSVVSLDTNVESFEKQEDFVEEETVVPVPESIWFAVNPEGMTLETRIEVPEGYERIQYEEDSFGAFVRNYPLKEIETPVFLHNGERKGNQSAHISVFDMDLTSGDLQQCADSVIRMYAEYHYQQKEYDKIAFHFVSGFLCDFETWVQGNRVEVQGNQVNWTNTTGYDDSLSSFESYLRTVFSYASTLSMEKEGMTKPIPEVEIGDVFLKGGSPGHVAMVVDVCQNDQGEKAFLLGQGYMPAQDFHLLKNPKDSENPWYYVEELTFPLSTPEYSFHEDSFYTLAYD